MGLIKNIKFGIKISTSIKKIKKEIENNAECIDILKIEVDNIISSLKNIRSFIPQIKNILDDLILMIKSIKE